MNPNDIPTSVVVVALLFLGFVILMALRGWKTSRQTKQDVDKELGDLYTHTQNRHKKRKGRASSELAEAHRSHLKLVNGRASASKL